LLLRLLSLFRDAAIERKVGAVIALFIAPFAVTVLGGLALNYISPTTMPTADLSERLEVVDVSLVSGDSRLGKSPPLDVTVLRQALGQAERWGLVTRNAARLAEPPRIPRWEVSPLSPEEARRFLDAIHGDRLEALYTVALGVGLRQGEILGLTWSDVAWIRQQLPSVMRSSGLRVCSCSSSRSPPRVGA
jgi:integrase